METNINILLAGNDNLCEFFSLFLSKKEITTNKFKNYKEEIKGDPNFQASIVFAKTDIHHVEDEIKEIKSELPKLPLLVIAENTKFPIIDSLYQLGVKKIAFDFNPDEVLNEVNKLVNESNDKTNNKNEKKDYIIQFHENNNAFIIDISGTLQVDKIKPLKLMFYNYLKNKIDKLKVIVYLFSDTDEQSMTFENIWTLIRIWKEIGINFKKITYLSKSEIIINEMNKYFKNHGVRHFENLLDIVKEYFPEMKSKNEEELFEYSSKLLEAKG